MRPPQHQNPGQAIENIAPPAPPIPPRRLPRPLRIFLYLDLALLALATACETFSRFVLHLGFPYNSPLLHEHFPDVIDMRARYRFFHTLQFYTDTRTPRCMYPAPTSVCYRFLYLFQPHDLGLALTFIAVCCTVAAALFARELIRRGLPPITAILLMATVLLTSYPLWFELKQANVEIVVWVLVTAGVWLFLRGRGYSAAACFGIAGAMKIYPFLYLALFLARRRFREIAAAAAIAIAVTIPSLWLVYPHLLQSWQLSRQNIASFREVKVLGLFPESGADHSIFGLIKASFGHLLPSPPVLSHILTAYMAIAAVSALLLWFFRIRHLPLVNQIAVLSVLSILLPPTSYDYTLLHLYVPWALLVLLALRSQLSPRPTREVPGLLPAFICFAFLFVPETELIYHTHAFGGQIKAITLLTLLLIALVYPLYATESSGIADSCQGPPWSKPMIPKKINFA